MLCYVALLFTEASGRHRIEFPDFAGCAVWVQSLSDAPRITAKLLADEIQARRAAHSPVPRPTAAEIAAAAAAGAGALPVVVPVPIPVEEGACVSVELPAGLVERVDRRARSHGVDRADLLAKAARLVLWETLRPEHGANGRARA